MKPFMPLFMLLPVTISVNDQKGENKRATNNKNENNRLAAPQISHKIR